MPLPNIIETLSDIPEEHVINTFDALTFEQYDIDLAYAAA
jgi:hypothetical protein